VEVRGLTAGAVFTLARATGDPAGPASGWPLTLVSSTTGTVTLRLPTAEAVPAERRVDVTATQEGLLVGRDSIGVTLVPRISGHTGTVSAGSTVQLATAHAGAGTEVFLRGRRLAAGAVTVVSPIRVDVTIPAGTPSGPLPASLRAGKVAGPVYEGMTVGP
jgi:hypothetical protein